MSRRSLLCVLAVSLGLGCLGLGCDEPALDCSDDPEVDCCEVDPTRPECAPTCETDPSRPECMRTCAEDPFQAACRVSCEDEATAPHCVPPSAGPTAEVEVIRDSLGIPHLFAADDADAMWASGYMQAHDRLFQMDLARRRALGRQAEVMGEDKVGDDTLMRTVDIAGWAEQGALRMQRERPETYALLVAWTAGVNTRIDEVLAGDAATPQGFTQYGFVPERWRVVDGAAVGKLLLFGSSNQIENDILATIIRDYLPAVWESVPLLMPLETTYSVPEADRPGSTSSGLMSEPPAPSRAPRVLPPDTRERLLEMYERLGTASGEGSNNWAVDGRHTGNGRSMIAGDPHQPLRTPSLFWAHHMHSATGLDVAGFNFVGAPGVHLGHNAHVVWTATLNYPDMMDLWDVRTSGSVANVGGTEVEVLSRTETIEVAGADPVQITVDRVPGYGVFLPDDLAPVPIATGGRRILYNWTGFAPTDDLGGFFGMNTAANVDELEAAIDSLEIGAFNFIGADTDDILYLTSCWLPERTNVSPTRLPWTLLDGDDAESYWTGAMVPRELMPRSRAVDRGWIATANNDPFGNTADGDSTNDAYYFGVYFDPGTRAERIHQELERLATRGDMTLDDMTALQTDTHSLLADHLIPLLEDAWTRLPTDEALAPYRDRPELETLHTLLADWDRRMERTQAAPVAFTALMYLFAKLAIEDEFSLVFEPVLSAETVYLLKVPLLAAEGAYGGVDLFQDGVPATVMAALSATASWLTATYGGVDPTLYRWDTLHCTRFSAFAPVDGLDGGCVPTDGGDGTVNVSSANLLSGGVIRDEHHSGGGAIYRMVATFGDDGVPEARVSFPRGNSEDPESPYFDNNLDDWVEGRYRDLPFRRADVEADAQETLTLAPR